jgi:hypothetical protein
MIIYEEILNGTFDISSNRANQQMGHIWTNMIKYPQISSNLTERFFQMAQWPGGEPQDNSLYLLNLGTLNLSILLAPAD